MLSILIFSRFIKVFEDKIINIQANKKKIKLKCLI